MTFEDYYRNLKGRERDDYANRAGTTYNVTRRTSRLPLIGARLPGRH